MRIACPACSAAYDVPAERLRPGRTVKCARCGGAWTPVEAPPPAAPPATPPAIDPPEPPPAAPEPPAVEPASQASDTIRVDPAPAPAASRRPVLALAWVLTAVLLAAVIGIAVARRHDIMRVWPPSQRVYSALGLAP